MWPEVIKITWQARDDLTKSQIVPAYCIPDAWMALDIGPNSIKAFSEALDTTKTVIWYGSMGVFEFDKFAAGAEEWAPDGGDGGDGGGYGDIHLEEDIIYYITLDNAEGLKSLFTHPAVSYGTYRYCRATVLRYMCIHSAVKCATALLDGKLGIKVDINRDMLLHQAAFFMSPQLVKLFLHYGAQTDVRFMSKKPWDSMRRLNGMLPLNIALDAARGMVYSDLQKSVFTGIVSLCRPSLESALAANKLLVESYNNIEEFALYYAMEGKLIELAVLLIVAREKVLIGKMMIPQFVRNQILSLVGEQVKLAGECKHREVTEIQQKMIGMNSMALLLEVFERAGHTIGEYLQSQQRGVCILIPRILLPFFAAER
ncbi:hypothetical protein Vadar_002600 [Vaccinium darrowii]|uniref:Uncharacterized protein n=1 Tax=Vaccinium darrowii TaxID=229202 RepID=A0ACB7Z1V1_9ERIC|nr:hypothetical protein Vadar_002600 [Vaccinium darrowii]